MWNALTFHVLHREDWELDDPTGKSDEEFKKVISTIETKIKELKDRLKS